MRSALRISGRALPETAGVSFEPGRRYRPAVEISGMPGEPLRTDGRSLRPGRRCLPMAQSGALASRIRQRQTQVLASTAPSGVSGQRLCPSTPTLPATPPPRRKPPCRCSPAARRRSPAREPVRHARGLRLDSPPLCPEEQGADGRPLLQKDLCRHAHAIRVSLLEALFLPVAPVRRIHASECP